MEEKNLDKKSFSIIARARSFIHAFRGVGVVIKTQHNAWVHMFFAVVTVVLGYVLEISSIEWILIVFAIGFVLVAEAFNTAIEIDIDLTSPEYHPYAKATKNVAAGAVLISVIVSVVVGLIVFVPKIIAFY
ncbi:diacylglycerol kinase family protein [Candidatus Nomurabacteria bacterium]|nr:diacylglycerol kinase family protein [Candidatus Nomurabacteria bacterium]